MEENEWYERAWERMEAEDFAQAQAFFEQAIKDGVAEAYCDLGNLYFMGNGVGQDYGRAFELFKKGAKAGNPDCMRNLGICYFWGFGTEADLHNSAFYMEKAAKEGVVGAMFDIGLYYERGHGVSQNIEKAIEWLEKAAAEGYPTALAELADLFYAGEFVEKDLEKAFHYYQSAMEAGDTISQLLISKFYEDGIVVDKDIEKAKALYQEAYDILYERAVTEDDTEAQFRLGGIFFYGAPLIDIGIDYMQAAEWLREAAENDSDQAQNSLGNLYSRGLGVEQNYEKAFYWYSQAAKRNHRTAISNLANLYYLGRGVAQDYGKAAELHTKAANLGYANSQEVLGEMYMDGKGVERNYTRAVYWLKESCENGERSAFGPLGDCYRKGFGVEKDERKAFGLYKKGAEMGDLWSKVSMSECLIEGWGTQSDLLQATRMLEMVCSDEEDFRENLVTTTSHEDQYGVVFIEDPLDKENLPHYAKAYYLLGALSYTGNGTSGTNRSKALALLRMAERLGFEDKERPELDAGKLIEKIQDDCREDAEAGKCYVEIKDVGSRRNKSRFNIIVHHANGTESEVRFATERRKFCYLLLLLIISNKNSAQGLMPRFFCYGRERLAHLARTCQFAGNVGEGQWIDEFIYDMECDEKSREWHYAYNSKMYSNEARKASEGFREVCSDDEMELFKIRMTGGQNSMTSIGVGPMQIVVPDSLAIFTKDLPSREDMLVYRPVMRRPEDFASAKRLNSAKYEDWEREIRD